MSDIQTLTKQETRVLIALSSGSLYKEIASDHQISINTVKKHLKNIYRKLNVGKRTHAIEKFLQFASQNEVHHNEVHHAPMKEQVGVAV